MFQATFSSYVVDVLSVQTAFALGSFLVILNLASLLCSRSKTLITTAGSTPTRTLVTGTPNVRPLFTTVRLKVAGGERAADSAGRRPVGVHLGGTGRGAGRQRHPPCFLLPHPRTPLLSPSHYISFPSLFPKLLPATSLTLPASSLLLHLRLRTTGDGTVTGSGGPQSQLGLITPAFKGAPIMSSVWQVIVVECNVGKHYVTQQTGSGGTQAAHGNRDEAVGCVGGCGS